MPNWCSPTCREKRKPSASKICFQGHSMRLFCSLLLFVSALAAEPADWIWTGRYVVTMDPQRRVIEDGAIAIRGERILAAGRRSDIEGRYQASQRVDRPNAILAPGLINTHTHAAM